MNWATKKTRRAGRYVHVNHVDVHLWGIGLDTTYDTTSWPQKKNTCAQLLDRCRRGAELKRWFE